MKVISGGFFHAANKKLASNDDDDNGDKDNIIMVHFGHFCMPIVGRNSLIQFSEHDMRNEGWRYEFRWVRL